MHCNIPRNSLTDSGDLRYGTAQKVPDDADGCELGRMPGRVPPIIHETGFSPTRLSLTWSLQRSAAALGCSARLQRSAAALGCSARLQRSAAALDCVARLQRLGCSSPHDRDGPWQQGGRLQLQV